MIETDRLLGAVRRRLRIGWLVAMGQEALPFVAGAALVLVLVGWVTPWGWLEPAALVVVVLAIVALVAATLFVRVTTPMAARAADRNLQVKDVFTAALQFRDHDRFGPEIVERAERFAASTDARAAAPWKGHPRRWLLAALIGLAAVALAFIANPQDDARAEAAATQETLNAEADELEETAEAIRALDEPTEAEVAVAAELERLAEELRELNDLAEAEQVLRDASTELAPDASALFATKAAVQGLNRSLEAQPLPGASGDAASQLEQLAADLDSLSDEEAEALADRLESLAATQGAGNPAAAGALSDAAAALRAGNTAGAEAALGEASGAQSAGEGEVREGQVGQAGSGAASEAANRLGDAQGSGTGEGSGGEGQGSGEGSGSGGEGSGSGEGQGSGGEGEGSGEGQGSGGGNPSGDVTGASGGSGAEGQGGEGNPVGGGDSTEVGTELETPTLFNPGGSSEDLFAGGSAQGESETVGLGQGPTNAGGAQVPVGDVLGEFERQAVAALNDPSIAPSQRDLVQRYFDRLAGLDQP